MYSYANEVLVDVRLHVTLPKPHLHTLNFTLIIISETDNSTL